MGMPWHNGNLEYEFRFATGERAWLNKRGIDNCFEQKPAQRFFIQYANDCENAKSPDRRQHLQ